VTARMKVQLLLVGLVSLNLAVWGLKHILAGAFDPVIRSLGA